MDEQTAQDVADMLAAKLREAGIEVGRGGFGAQGVFASLPIRLPNGQVFKIQVEETF